MTAAIILSLVVSLAIPSGIVDVTVATVPDQHWIDDYSIIMTATWERPYDPSRYDMEVWVEKDLEWVRWQVVPSARGKMVIERPSGPVDPWGLRFYLRDIKTNKTMEWALGDISFVEAQVQPPPHASVWYWDATKHRFVLGPLPNVNGGKQ